MRLGWALLGLYAFAGPSSSKSGTLSPGQVREMLAADPRGLELLNVVDAQEASFKSDAPKEIKAALVKAHLDFAEYVYLKSTLKDDARLRIALRSYRRVQEVHPENADARARVQMIVNVYEAWGKPVPKEPSGRVQGAAGRSERSRAEARAERRARPEVEVVDDSESRSESAREVGPRARQEKSRGER